MKLLKKFQFILENKNCKLILFLIILICWIPTLIAFFPGILNYDGPFQIKSFYKGNVSTHHPIIHTILLSFLYSMGALLFKYPTQGAILYTLFQMCTMALIFSYTTKFIYDSTKNVKYSLAVLLFFSIFPINAILPLMTSKDILFAGLVLLYIVQLFKTMEEPIPSRQNYIDLILITVLMLLFRNNAIYSFLLSFPFWLLLTKNKNKLKFILLFLVCIVLFFTCSIMLKTVTNASKGSDKEKISIITQSTGKIAKTEFNSLTSYEKDKINYYYNDITVLANSYIPYLSDNTKDLLDYDKVLANKKDFYEFSIQLIKKYPLLSLQSFLETCQGYWNIFDNTFCSINNEEFPKAKGYLEITFYKIHDDNYVAPNYFPAIREFYISMFCENNYRYIPVIKILFQPAFYFYFLLGYTIYELHTKNRKNLIPAIFLLSYFITCFLGPCAIIRYIYCIIVCTPVLLSKILTFTKK